MSSSHSIAEEEVSTKEDVIASSTAAVLATAVTGQEKEIHHRLPVQISSLALEEVEEKVTRNSIDSSDVTPKHWNSISSNISSSSSIAGGKFDVNGQPRQPSFYLVKEQEQPAMTTMKNGPSQDHHLSSVMFDTRTQAVHSSRNNSPRQDQEAREEIEEEDDDEVGTRIAQLLNSGKFPEFLYETSMVATMNKEASNNSSTSKNGDKDSFYPLLSLHNFKRLHSYLFGNNQQTTTSKSSTTSAFSSKSTKLNNDSTNDAESDTNNTSSNNNLLEIILQSYLITLPLLTILLTTFTLQQFLFNYIIFILALISYLVDIRDILTLCPKPLKQIGDKLWNIWIKIERDYLFGLEYRGRASGSAAAFNLKYDQQQQQQYQQYSHLDMTQPPAALVRSKSKTVPMVQTTDGKLMVASGLLSRNVDFDEIIHSLEHPRGSDGNNVTEEEEMLGKNTVDHLTAVIFSFVMLNSTDHKAHSRITGNSTNTKNNGSGGGSSSNLQVGNRKRTVKSILEKRHSHPISIGGTANSGMRGGGAGGKKTKSEVKTQIIVTPKSNDSTNYKSKSVDAGLNLHHGHENNIVGGAVIRGGKDDKMTLQSSHDDIYTMKRIPSYPKRKMSSSFQSFDEIEVLDVDVCCDENQGGGGDCGDGGVNQSRSRHYSDGDLYSYIASNDLTEDNRTGIYSISDDDDLSLSVLNSNFSGPSYEDKETKAMEDLKKKKWLDVGAKIGISLLKSKQVQKVIGQQQQQQSEDQETLRPVLTIDTREDEDEFQQTQPCSSALSESAIAKPFHSIWMSPSGQTDTLVQNPFDFTSEDSSPSHSRAPSDDDDYDSDSSFSEEEVSVELQQWGSEKKKSPSQKRRKRTSVSPRRQLTDLGIKAWKEGGKSESRPSSLSSSPVNPKPLKTIKSTSDLNTNDNSKNVESPPPPPPPPLTTVNQRNYSISSETISSKELQPIDANCFLPASMTLSHGKPYGKNISTKMNKVKKTSAHTIGSSFTPSGKEPNNRLKVNRERPPLSLGVKMIVSMYPYSSKTKFENHYHYQLATVTSSSRIALNDNLGANGTDCLSITVALDKAYLRDRKFAIMTLRIPDSRRQMPRHSKFPIGSCVATSFGIGVLVGWRVEDDCHIIRSLWQRRGIGTGHAYLNRNALHEVVEASVGFEVVTSYGPGKVIGYQMGKNTFQHGEFLVQVKKAGRTNNALVVMKRSDVLECKPAKFIPVIEQIKESAKYQMQVEMYQAAMLQRVIEEDDMLMDRTWRVFSEGFELFLSSFIKAAEEDENFDSEINNFLSSVIKFLEDFDLGDKKLRREQSTLLSTPTRTKNKPLEEDITKEKEETGFWLINDLFGEMMNIATPRKSKAESVKKSDSQEQLFSETYKKIYAFLQTVTRTVTIARSTCTNDQPNMKMALSIIHEILLFVRTVIKVQQKNMSQASLEAWQRTLNEFAEIFGPINKRLQKVANGIAERLEMHGNIAKLRALRFLDILVGDDRLMEFLEMGEVTNCLRRLEIAAVTAEIVKEEDCARYHKLFCTLYDTMAPRAQGSQEAAMRNGKKFTLLAKTLKLLVTPSRSLLMLLTQDDTLNIMERLLVRVFEREIDAAQVLNIYSWNFRTLRHLRVLNNLAISGKLWAPVLDAADEEFAWAVSRTPENTQDYVRPISKLFSLGVARFHELRSANFTPNGDWLDFLMEDDAIGLIQDLDQSLMLFLKNLCNDVEEMMDILPYYSSIDEDILNLIDEVNLDQVLKEASEAFVDNNKFPEYVHEKSKKAISRFLDFLPKISIPVEKKDIGDGWVITCRGRNGKDLTLSNVTIEENDLLCKVLGSGNVLKPVLEDDYNNVSDNDHNDKIELPSTLSIKSDEEGNVEVSILDHVAELIKNAQSHGFWNTADGGEMYKSPTHLRNSSLNGLPLSKVLICAIDLWENLEIDDDELVEIAIRDISYQIRIEDTREKRAEDGDWPEEASRICSRREMFHQKPRPPSFEVDICNTVSMDSMSPINSKRRFDPRKDPTILFVAMNNLTCSLDDFTFRVEPTIPKTIFDPAFEGAGSLSIKNASIKLRIECRKERIRKMAEELTVPVLQLQELDVGLEQVQFRFKETGVDWVLNKLVSNFSNNITQVVKENFKDQIALSINAALDNLNSYIEVNPDIMLKILGITIDDLEENVAWV